MKLSKKKWLEQEVMCDEWGRPPSLADVPLTIMTRKNALIKQFQSLFRMDGVNLDIKSDALKMIADFAVEQKTGARGLRSIVEKLLMDLMYDVPDMNEPNKIMITEKFILGKSKPLISLDPIKKKSA